MASDRRSPSAAHAKKNGFHEPVGPVDAKNPDDITLRNVRYALYVLANKGSYVPSPETLRKLGETKTVPVETVDTLNEKIRELKKQHAKDLESLLQFQMSECHQELIDHRICHDDSAYMNVDEAYPDQVAFRDALQDFDRRVLQMDRFKRDMDDAVSKLRYTHLKTLLSLIQRRNTLQAEEKNARQKRDAMFPKTVDDYQRITERDVQLRVARFLTSTTTEQEKMRDEYQWPYLAVQPLLSVYKSNPTFRTEVNSTISGLFVPDPRRKPSHVDETPVFTRFEPTF